MSPSSGSDKSSTAQLAQQITPAIKKCLSVAEMFEQGGKHKGPRSSPGQSLDSCIVVVD